MPGSLVLVGGDPGVGKSTLLLQIAGMLAAPGLDFDAMVDGARARQGAAQHRQHGQGDSGADSGEGDGSASEGEEQEGSGEEEAAGGAAGGTPRVLYVSGEEMEDQVSARHALANRCRGMCVCVRVLRVQALRLRM